MTTWLAVAWATIGVIKTRLKRMVTWTCELPEAGLTVQVKVAAPDAPVPSLAVTVTLELPAAVGVPEISPEELMLSPKVSLDADVRYIFINASNQAVINRDFNYYQITGGVNFYF